MPEYLDWIQTVANVMSALGIIAATALAWKTIESARRIARRRSTFEIRLQDEIDQGSVERRRKFVALCKKGNLEQFAIEENWDTEGAHLLQTILNRYEFVSTGIHYELIDADSYKALCRSTLVDDWIKCQSFVSKLRNTKKNSNLYYEFHKLALNWANPQELPLLQKLP